MSNKLFLVLLVILWTIPFSLDQRYQSNAAKAERDYPNPEYLKFPKLTDKQLMFMARHISRQTETRSGAVGLIDPGKKGLIVTKDDQDLRVLNFIIKALKERNADADYVYTTDLLEKCGYPREYATRLRDMYDNLRQPNERLVVWGLNFYRYQQSYFSPEVWAQVPDISKQQEEVGRHHIKNACIKKYTDAHPEYDYVFIEYYGSEFQRRELEELFQGKIAFSQWRYYDEADVLVEGQTTGVAWRALEQKIWDIIPWIRHVHFTDPEGTDFQFSVSAEDAHYWQILAYGPNYMNMYPLQATQKLFIDTGLKHQVVPESSGVIAGTGAFFWSIFPRMELKVEHGQIVQVKGGGLLGTVINDLVQRYKDVQVPYFPHPGWGYIYHIEMPVNPKETRHIDWGFGNQTSIPEAIEFEKKNNFPLYHNFHFRNFFPTYEVTLSSGKKIKLVEKGYMTFVDDPEIRAIASKYGDPDEVLRAEDAPPIPGVNAPGDYWKDYVPDPQAYWIKQEESVKAGKNPYIVYRLPAALQQIEDEKPQEEKGIFSKLFQLVRYGAEGPAQEHPERTPVAG